jgi:hypothetical protein
VIGSLATALASTEVKGLNIAGAALIFAGAFVQSWRDLRGGGRVTWNDAARAFPRTRAAWVAFPLITLGSLLLIVAAARS